MGNPTIDCLTNHRSVRKFKPDLVPSDVVDRILDVGIRAATGGNLQPYALVAVDDPRQLEKIGHYDAPLAVVALVDQYRLKRYYELNDAPFYHDQPINLFISYWDATIALQNVVIAAESLGLGTVYIGMILSTNIQEILGTPEYVFPAGLVMIGYPNEEPERRPRLPRDAVVHRDRYRVPTDSEIQTWYADQDAAWKARVAAYSDKRQAELQALGVTNRAQHITVGHYTEEFLQQESRGLLANLTRARFRLGPA